MGIFDKITIALLAVLLLAIVGLLGWHFIDRARLQSQITAATAATTAAEKARDDAQVLARRAQEANTANLATITRLEQERAQQSALVEAEAQRRAAIQSRYDALTTRYQEAIQNDQATRAWAATALPDAVRRLLNDAGTANGDGHGNPDGDNPASGGDGVQPNVVRPVR